KDINEYIDIIKFLLIIPDATIINPSSINNITGNFRNLITLLITIGFVTTKFGKNTEEINNINNACAQ
ncbi:YitT family protein, partial [Clostridioides difficile]